MKKLESQFQSKLIKELKARYPGCVVMKTNPNYIQGLPDLIVLIDDFWCALECKREGRSTHRPNQDWYIAKMNSMSFAAFIYPENKEVVLDELSRSFKS